MPTSTRKNGITLIALIITIIVMLILVGVTINVTLNGGLFQKANTASNQTQREADKEHLLSLITGTLNDTGNLQLNATNLSKERWHAEISSENTDYFECTSSKGEMFFVNKDTGKILDKLPEPPGDVYYDITFKELSNSDWTNTSIQLGTLYIIGLEHDDQNQTKSFITFQEFEGNYVSVGYVPDFINNMYSQYLYDYQNNRWNHYENIMSGPSDSNVETLEVERVKILTEEEMASYLVNGNTNGLPYESILYTKTPSQE